MSLADDLIEDQKAFFDSADFAEEISYSNTSGVLYVGPCVFNENQVGIVAFEAGQTTDFEAIVSIPRKALEQAFNGDKIIRKKDGYQWRVERVVEQDEVSINVLCIRKLLQKVKA